MAGLIKKQILKILTKFTDGLTPDDIQEFVRNNSPWDSRLLIWKVRSFIKKILGKILNSPTGFMLTGLLMTNTPHLALCWNVFGLMQMQQTTYLRRFRIFSQKYYTFQDYITFSIKNESLERGLMLTSGLVLILFLLFLTRNIKPEWLYTLRIHPKN